MKRILITLVLTTLLFTPSILFAANIEMLDEMTLGLELEKEDLIWNTKYFNLGAKIGAFDFHNSDSIKNSAYAMGTVHIKGDFSIINSITNLFNK